MEKTYTNGMVIDGRYQIEQLLGKGGTATVYHAQDLMMNRQVALKMFFPKDGELAIPERAFQTEMRAISRLAHRNIVGIYDAASSTNGNYIVMEYLNGVTLSRYMEHAKEMTTPVLFSFAKQILSAMEEAHNKGILHRDIKPQNVMVMQTGQVKVTDFGIACLPGADAFKMGKRAVGSVYYMSPEQAKGDPTDTRSDVYALGVLFYHMATGRLPFDGEDVGVVAMKQITTLPERPRKINPKLSIGFEQIILKAMQKDPECRYRNASSMLKDLEILSENENHIFRTVETFDGEDEENIKARKKQRTCRILLFCGIGVLALAMLFLVMFLAQRNEPIMVTMPNVVGEYYTDSLFEGTGVVVVQINQSRRSDISPNVIISQSIKPGTTAENKIEVILEIAVSKPPVVVANLKGHYQIVKATLSSEYPEMGFRFAEIFVSSNTVPVNEIISSKCSTGEVTQQNCLITFTVSSGPAEYVVMPDLSTLTIDEACAILQRFGVLYQLEYANSDTVEKNDLISQSVQPGEKVPKKVTNAVTVIYSSGAKNGNG